MFLLRRPPAQPVPVREPTAEDWSVAAAAFGAVFAGRDFSDWEMAAMVDELVRAGVGE